MAKYVNKGRMISMAKEWATELGKFAGHEQIVAEETVKGFADVERGRNPDIVLREVLAKIGERIACPPSDKDSTTSSRQ